MFGQYKRLRNEWSSVLATGPLLTARSCLRSHRLYG